MIVLSQLGLLTVLHAAPAAALPDATPTAAPQAPLAKTSEVPPTSGTPEPAGLLLLAGGAIGYGIYRLRRRRSGVPEKD